MAVSTGRAPAGGHAFLGIVDVALELHRDKQVVRRRIVKGWARVIEVPDLVYEMEDSGDMHLLGDRSLLDFNELKNRLQESLNQEAVNGEWQSTKDIEEAIAATGPKWGSWAQSAKPR